MSKTKEGFKPMRLQLAPRVDTSSFTKVTISGTLKGPAAEEFEKMRESSGLNRSQLMVQMIYHCLGKTDELKDFYKRLAILGE